MNLLYGWLWLLRQKLSWKTLFKLPSLEKIREFASSLKNFASAASSGMQRARERAASSLDAEVVFR